MISRYHFEGESWIVTCIARRFPVGSVKTPDKKQPIGTHSRFIEPLGNKQ